MPKRQTGQDWKRSKVNVEKCGVMHMRMKGVKRKEEKFYVGGKEIGIVEEYMYLGGVVDGHVECRKMVEERGRLE